MKPLAPDNLLPPAILPGADTRANVKRDADRPSVSDPDAAPKENPVSVRVVLSDDALERAAKTRQGMAPFVAHAAQTRHDQALLRITQIKQRIEALKKILMLLGKAAAKSILRELRQLSRELGQAATALKDSGGAQPGAAAPLAHVVGGAAIATGGNDAANGSAVAPTDGADGAANTDDAQAQAAAPAPAAAARALTAYAAVGENTVAADPNAADAADADRATAANDDAAAKDPSLPSGPDTADGQDKTETSASASWANPTTHAKRRQEDAQAVRDAIRVMKELLAMLKRLLHPQDKAAQKQTAEIQDTLKQTEQTAQALDAGPSPTAAS